MCGKNFSGSLLFPVKCGSPARAYNYRHAVPQVPTIIVMPVRVGVAYHNRGAVPARQLRYPDRPSFDVACILGSGLRVPVRVQIQPHG